MDKHAEILMVKYSESSYFEFPGYSSDSKYLQILSIAGPVGNHLIVTGLRHSGQQTSALEPTAPTGSGKTLDWDAALHQKLGKQRMIRSQLYFFVVAAQERPKSVSAELRAASFKLIKMSNGAGLGAAIYKQPQGERVGILGWQEGGNMSPSRLGRVRQGREFPPWESTRKDGGGGHGVGVSKGTRIP